MGRVQPVPGVRRRRLARRGWPLRDGGGARRVARAGALRRTRERDGARPATPSRRAEIVRASQGCRTAKVKVAEPGQSPARTRPGSRRCATRSAPTARVRIDANGGWSVDEAVARIPVLERAAGGLEYVEQPCATVEDLAAVRRRVAGADRGRRVDPPGRGPLPGARPRGGRHGRAQGAAARRRARLPADRRGHRAARRRLQRVESSIGIAAGVALAAALPELPYACGLATVQLLTGDVVDEPLLPVDGELPCAGPRSPRRGWPRSPPPPTGWSTGGGGSRRSRSGGRAASRSRQDRRP